MTEIKECLAKGNESSRLYLKMSDSREIMIKLESEASNSEAMTSEFGTIMRNGNLLFTIDC